jgi:NitT/TauT family transport system permease protein
VSLASAWSGRANAVRSITVFNGAGAPTPCLFRKMEFVRSSTPAWHRALPFLVVLVVLVFWWWLSARGVFTSAIFPSPAEVVEGFREELGSGRLPRDIASSLFRVTLGFVLAVLLGVPLGLWLGQSLAARAAFLPVINFCRSISPLAWIPFAILWFGIGDKPAVFLIFMATFFPLVLSTMAAVTGIPSVYFRVAHDYGLRGLDLLLEVTLPAILPQLITALRVTAGLAWLVVVAAEMIAGDSGLGFAIWDARNGLRNDLLVVEIFVIGCIGILLDRLLSLWTRAPGVRWGYER